MSKSDIVLLKHILDEISFVLNNTSGKEATSVWNDQILSRAIIRSLEIIGEASGKVSREFRQHYGQIEWRKISDTRNRLIHNYMGVDYDIVWDIITEKLPDLDQKLKHIIDLHDSA